jgi:hypothetical protein
MLNFFFTCSETFLKLLRQISTFIESIMFQEPSLPIAIAQKLHI